MRIQKILVTGANGQLGWAFSQAAKVNPNFEFIFLDRSKWIYQFRVNWNEFTKFKKNYI